MPPHPERGRLQRTCAPPRPQADVPPRHDVPPPRPSSLLSTNIRASLSYPVPSPRPERGLLRRYSHISARHDVPSQITDWLAELSVSPANVPSPPPPGSGLPSRWPRPSLPAFLTLNPHNGIVTPRPQANRDGDQPPRPRASVLTRPRHSVPPPRPPQANLDPHHQSPRRSRLSRNTNRPSAQAAVPLAPSPPFLIMRDESALEDQERPELEIPDPKRSGLCVICQDEEAIMAVVDCGHLAMCRGCSEQVMRTSPECPLCRTRIVTEARLIRIFKT
ncbi:hypothetical protein B0H19DRAFT_231876 [Mycena capillaripes]|nr:hypothetical protein B0H19DRAFT_231876 [Mycena capillaripes]